ncbi:MAG: 50S ribosomal protein L18 [Proteobacteria bacterium]|nr:MAG: 50S ribosomal protein L18 [Pseudomonadota bacterium]
MAIKKETRLRRARKTRARISRDRKVRLCLHRTPRHIYAQIIDVAGDVVLTSASTLEADLRQSLKNGGNVDAAVAVGKRIAEKAMNAGIKSVAFDRSGFKYHGRTKAFADAAREAGLEF